MSEAGSGIEGMLDDSAFARFVAQALKTELMNVVDVGCAGGLPRGMRAFGDRLAAVGFDTDAQSIEDLRRDEANPRVSYVQGFVGLPEGHSLRVHQGRRYSDRAYWHLWVDHRLSFDRTAALRRDRQAGAPTKSIEEYYREVVLPDTWNPQPLGGFDLDYLKAFDETPPTDDQVAQAVVAAEAGGDILLPAYLKAVGFDKPDFIKIDVDGPDFDILRSLGPVLRETSLLGLAIEVSFYGSQDANDNSFHNVDRLMRQKGFDLFALSVRKYSSAALPVRYLDVHPSMTGEGRPIQGDAIYLRDLSSRARKTEAAAVSEEKLLKLAALFSLCTLPDHAAELLLVHRARLEPIIDIDKALDLLAVEVQRNDNRVVDYRQYMAEFEEDHPRFFDEYGAKATWLAQLQHDAGRGGAEREDAKAQLEAMRQTLNEEYAEGWRLRAQLADTEARVGLKPALGRLLKRLAGKR